MTDLRNRFGRTFTNMSIGARSGIQGSVREHEREGGEVDLIAINCIRRYLCLAAFAPSRFFH